MFSVVLLGKRLSAIRLGSLLLLAVGVSLTQLKHSPQNNNGDTSDSMGMAAVMLLVTLSGFAGVYTEKVLKGPETAKVPFCFMQILLALISLVLGCIFCIYQDYASILNFGPFFNFNRYACLTIVLNAAGGVLVAATLKYASSVAKVPKPNSIPNPNPNRDPRLTLSHSNWRVMQSRSLSFLLDLFQTLPSTLRSILFSGLGV